MRRENAAGTRGVRRHDVVFVDVSWHIAYSARAVMDRSPRADGGRSQTDPGNHELHRPFNNDRAVYANHGHGGGMGGMGGMM
jgi:hypothetical protein